MLTALIASPGEISPNSSTNKAPIVITCHIWSLKDPTCLRAVSKKTPRRISTEGSGKDERENSIDPAAIEPTNLKIKIWNVIMWYLHKYKTPALVGVSVESKFCVETWAGCTGKTHSSGIRKLIQKDTKKARKWVASYNLRRWQKLYLNLSLYCFFHLSSLCDSVNG